MCVIAGPGSGKTSVIVYRIQSLILHHKISPDQILVITFTKAAALEMKSRFETMQQGNFYPVVFGTFHSVFFQILKQSFGYRANDLMTNQEKNGMIRDILMQLKKEKEEVESTEWEEIEEILSKISSVRNTCYSEIQTKKSKEDLFLHEVMQEYKMRKSIQRKLDFDDLILVCTEKLLQDKRELEYWQSRFQYILIDEFQDINPSQYQLVRLLALPQNNLFVVGDDDQSIYHFRGSDPSFMLEFTKKYPDAKQVILNLNFRSTEQIIQASNQIILENTKRIPKGSIESQKKGSEVICHGFQSQEEEIQNILKMIQQMICVRNPGEIAVLFRTSSAFEQIAVQLGACQIPFYSSEKITDRYSHFIADILLAYLKFAQTGKRVHFLKIMNKPMRYLSREGINEPFICLDELLAKRQFSESVRENVKRLAYDCAQIKSMHPYAAINYIRKGMGFDHYVKEIARKRGVEFEPWMILMDELQKDAGGYRTLEEWFCFIEEYQKLLEQNHCKQERKKGAVSLMTYHASKGLEWPCVILPDLNEGMIPHVRAWSAEEIEEERRMLYVGMTRAKEELFLFWILRGRGKEAHPSRFILNLIR